jgi:hypothetical protein
MRRFALVVSVAACALVLVTSGAGDVSSLARAQNATPSAACPVTTEDENEGTARRWFEGAINGADLSVIDEIVTADIVHHAGTFPDGERSSAFLARSSPASPMRGTRSNRSPPGTTSRSSAGRPRVPMRVNSRASRQPGST